jgi:hypothetical protein
MAVPDLSNYYGNLTPGEVLRIQAKIVLAYVTVGSGSFSILSPTRLVFSGNYSAGGHKGAVNINLTVTGDNVGTFALNGYRGSCTFEEEGNSLYIYFREGGDEKNVQAQAWAGGIWFGGQAAPYNIWIGP